MTTITLEKLQAEHERLGSMIATFVAQAPRIVLQGIQPIELKAGERWGGFITDDDGQTGHHVILLPGEATSVDFSTAKAWAAEAGGELPTRREQAQLFANLKGEFQQAAYWSSEEHASVSSYAWCQGFNSGGQGYGFQSDELKARAVRRLTIQ